MESESSQPIEVTIEAPAWNAVVTELDHLVRCAAAAALDELGSEARSRAEISVILTDDDAIRELNARHRDQDKTTNVLSFPTFPRDDFMPRHGPLLLGDLVLAHETVAREARETGKSCEAHLSHLVIHGVLHLIGHDHEDEVEAATMENAERRLMAMLGYDDPYAFDDAGADDAGSKREAMSEEAAACAR